MERHPVFTVLQAELLQNPNLEMQRALTNSLELYVLHFPCFMQSFTTVHFLSSPEMVKCYLFKIITSSVEAQVMQTGKINKVLIE